MGENVSILTKEQEATLLERFKDLVARAEMPAPDLKGFKGDTDAYSKAKEQYENNALFEKVQNYKKELDEHLKNGVAFEDAKKLYDSRIDKMRAGFLAGIRKGSADPDAERKQNDMIGSLMQGDFMGAIKQFVLMIPFVGDFIAGAMKFVRAKINGESMSWSQAQENIKLERALSGAAANIGVDEGALRYAGVSAARDPNFKALERPTIEPPKPSAEVVSAVTNAVADVQPVGISGANFSGPGGVIPEGLLFTPADTSAETGKGSVRSGP